MRRLFLGHVVMVGALLVGCGGGGGGGDGGGGGGGGGLITVDGGSAYTGPTTPATVDAASAQDFGAVATSGVEFGEGISEAAGATDAVAVGRTAALARTVFQPAADLAALLKQAGGRLAARTESETVQGPCGGSVTRTVDVPDVLQLPMTARPLSTPTVRMERRSTA